MRRWTLWRSISRPPRPSLPLDQEGEDAVLLGVLQKPVAGLLGECLEVAHRARVGRENPQNLPALHVVERFLGAQDRQRAVEPASIDFAIDLERRVHGLAGDYSASASDPFSAGLEAAD